MISQPEGLDRSQLTDAKVLRAVQRVDRSAFVPEGLKSEANADRALPIDCGQTISQPFVVALMIQEAQLRTGERVLEIGTGSGYQAAVLAELGVEVFSVEILPELAAQAKRQLADQGFQRVQLRCGDGAEGWKEYAPFDAILVAARAPYAPPELIAQLKLGGRLIIPLEVQQQPNDESDSTKFEELTLYCKTEQGLSSRTIADVRFVPMTGQVRTAAN